MNSITRRLAAATLLATAAGTGEAATLVHQLDQANRLADDIAYLQVTISDGAHGAIDFLVETLPSLQDPGRGHFGIQAFAFNFAAQAVGDDDLLITQLPDGWRVANRPAMDGFGQFSAAVTGRGNARLDRLRFSIEGIDGDTPADYALGFNGGYFYAARVAGLASAGQQGSAFIAGSTAVPLPATGWFGLTALGALAGALRRRRRPAP